MDNYNKVENELSIHKDKFIESYKKDAIKTVNYVKKHTTELTTKSVTNALKKLSKKKLSNILGNLDTINDSYKYSQVILQTRLHELFETFYYVIKLNVNISKILLDDDNTKEIARVKIYSIKDGANRIFSEKQVDDILNNVDLNTYLYKQFQSTDKLSGGGDQSTGSSSQCTLCEYEWMIFYLWYLEQSEIGPFVTDYLNILVSYLSFFDMFMNTISSVIVGSFQVMTMGMLGPVYRIMRTYLEGIGSSMLFIINVSRKRLDAAYANFIQTFPKLTTAIDFSTTQLTNINYFLDRSQYYTDYINNNSQEFTPIVDDYMQSTFKIYEDIMNTSVQQMDFMQKNMGNISQINISPQVQSWGYPYSTVSYRPGKTPLPQIRQDPVNDDIWKAMLPGMDVSYFKCCQTCKEPKKKYISIDQSVGICRESCLEEKEMSQASQVVQNLQQNNSGCRESGFSRYKQTDNIPNQPFKFDIYQQGLQSTTGSSQGSSQGSFNLFTTSPEKKAAKEAKKLAKEEKKAKKAADKAEKKANKGPGLRSRLGKKWSDRKERKAKAKEAAEKEAEREMEGLDPEEKKTFRSRLSKLNPFSKGKSGTKELEEEIKKETDPKKKSILDKLLRRKKKSDAENGESDSDSDSGSDSGSGSDSDSDSDSDSGSGSDNPSSGDGDDSIISAGGDSKENDKKGKDDGKDDLNVGEKDDPTKDVADSSNRTEGFLKILEPVMFDEKFRNAQGAAKPKWKKRYFVLDPATNSIQYFSGIDKDGKPEGHALSPKSPWKPTRHNAVKLETIRSGDDLSKMGKLTRPDGYITKFNVQVSGTVDQYDISKPGWGEWKARDKECIFRLNAKDEQEKKKWMDAINSSIPSSSESQSSNISDFVESYLKV
jgi:hypothetical protein